MERGVIVAAQIAAEPRQCHIVALHPATGLQPISRRIKRTPAPTTAMRLSLFTQRRSLRGNSLSSKLQKCRRTPAQAPPPETGRRDIKLNQRGPAS
jgi:hypothetical protein